MRALKSKQCVTIILLVKKLIIGHTQTLSSNIIKIKGRTNKANPQNLCKVIIWTQIVALIKNKSSISTSKTRLSNQNWFMQSPLMRAKKAENWAIKNPLKRAIPWSKKYYLSKRMTILKTGLQRKCRNQRQSLSNRLYSSTTTTVTKTSTTEREKMTISITVMRRTN